MLKTKLAAAIKKLSLPNKTKRQRLLIYLVVLLLLALVGYFIYRMTSESSDQKMVKARGQAGSLLANDEYTQAAKKLEAVYDKDIDDASKASDAYNIGQAYQSAQNYNAAIDWYNKALVSYRATGDKDGQGNTKQAIATAQKFQQAQGKTPAPSPVDRGK